MDQQTLLAIGLREALVIGGGLFMACILGMAGLLKWFFTKDFMELKEGQKTMTKDLKESTATTQKEIALLKETDYQIKLDLVTNYVPKTEYTETLKRVNRLLDGLATRV